MIISSTTISPLSLKRSGVGIYTSPTALHEWYRPNYTDVGTTITEVDTGNVGGMDMSNPDVPSEPTLAANTINFDGVTQYTRKLVDNFMLTETSGVMHIKVDFTAATLIQHYFGLGNTTFTNKWFTFGVKENSGKYCLFMQSRNGAIVKTKRGSTDVATGIHVFSYGCDGVNLDFWIDGVKELTYDFDDLTAAGYVWFGQAKTAGGIVSNGIMSSGRLTSSPILNDSSQIYKSIEPWVNDAAVSAKAIEILNNAI